LFIGVIVLLLMRGTHILQTDHRKLQILRGTFAAISPLCFVMAISFVPLVDAMAVGFIAPFIVTILGATWLKERVGIHRWGAVIVGFLGTLIIIRPGLGAVHPAIFFVFIAASLFAARQVLSRYLSTTDNTSTTMAYTALTGSCLLTLLIPFFWQWPNEPLHLLLFATITISAAISEIFVVKALEITQAVVLAPVQYSLIIWGTMYGFLVFGQLPDHWTWIGTAIIIAGGYYTFHREKLTQQPASKMSHKA
jgi:S-adenosylmethionine uptake transporter